MSHASRDCTAKAFSAGIIELLRVDAEIRSPHLTILKLMLRRLQGAATLISFMSTGLRRQIWSKLQIDASTRFTRVRVVQENTSDNGCI
jgi:hypothetical protein